MAKIEKITAREILDSRGNPAVESTVILDDGTVGVSSVPSGVSRSAYEAHVIRDGDDARYSGKGVLKAVENVTGVIAKEIVGMEANGQQKIDKRMIDVDGTQNKGLYGGNAILSVSQAVAKAAAKSSLLPLSVYLRQFISLRSETHKMPSPLFNLMEGGRHADNTLSFQEFLVAPATSYDFPTSLEMGVKIYNKLKEHLKDTGLTTGVADESGFAPDLTSNINALKMLKSAVEVSGYVFSKDVFLGVDAAADGFVSNRKYVLPERSGMMNTEELIEYYKTIVADYSLIYLEDPFAEDDWESWKKAYSDLGKSTLIAGDDLTSTNPYRLQTALNNNVINAIVIKPTQIGTITEALAVIEIARYKNLKIIVSGRSGETADTFIADFAVAVDADYIKFGAPAHERVIKYNRLLSIQDEIAKLSLL